MRQILKIRPARPIDADFWLAVRNDRIVRQWSRQRAEIGRDEHAAWFGDALKSADRRLFVVEMPTPRGWVRAGIARLDRRRKPRPWTELSLAIAPEHRERGVGKIVVGLLVEQARQLDWPTPGAVVAGQNVRSLRMFLGSGFAPSAKRWIEFRYARRDKR